MARYFHSDETKFRKVLDLFGLLLERSPVEQRLSLIEECSNRLNFDDDFSLTVLKELNIREIQFCGITKSGFSLAHFMLDRTRIKTFRFVQDLCKIDLTHRQSGLSSKGGAPVSLLEIALDRKFFDLARELIDQGAPVPDLGWLRLTPNEISQVFSLHYLLTKNFDELPTELKQIVQV